MSNVLCWGVRPKEGGAQLVVRDLKELEWVDAETSVGQVLVLERIEMTEEAFANLGEWEGW